MLDKDRRILSGSGAGRPLGVFLTDPFAGHV
jgi:hypothetical protein